MTSRTRFSSVFLLGIILVACLLAVPALTAQSKKAGLTAALKTGLVSVTPHRLFTSPADLAAPKGTTRAIEKIEYNLTRAATPVDKNPAWLKLGAGSKILFASNRDASDDGADATDNFDIWTMNEDGSGRSVVYADSATDDIEPVWSPSGTRLAFASKPKTGPDSDYQIYVYDLNQHSLIQVTHAADFPNGCRHPAWRSDGAGIVFQTNMGATGWDIYMVNLDGSGIVAIEAGPGDETDPKIYGDWLVFTSNSTDTDSNGVLDNSDGSKSDTDCWIARWLGYAASNAQPLVSTSANEKEPDIVTIYNSQYLDLVWASDVSGDFDIWQQIFARSGNTWNPQSTAKALLPASMRPNGFDDVDPSASPLAATPSSNPQAWANPKTAFTSTRTGLATADDNGTNVWLVSLDDKNPPVLMSLPQVTPRVSTPGATVTITAEVVDNESGVQSVWAVFHDADDPIYQGWYESNADPDGSLIENGASAAGLTTWKEAGYRVISAADGSGGHELTSIDDINGTTNDWGLRLYDDGTHGDATAGDNIYTATWTTPNRGIDFYVDIVPIDNNGNYMDNTSYGLPSYGYDNIAGFSTKTFTGGHRILYVGDYTCGQRFIATLHEGFTTNNYSRYHVAGIPVDHYLLHCPLPIYVPDPEATTTPVCTWHDALPPNPPLDESVSTWHWRVYLDKSTVQIGSQTFNYGADFPLRIFYSELNVSKYDQPDVWRILCRGPITSDVLASYLPRTTTDPVTGTSRLVSEKFVVWLSPYTGDLWTGKGTIRDLDTQARLKNFMDQGGRMVLSGQDVAWALSMGGAVSNDLLTNYFGVTFVSDGAYDEWVARHQLTGANGHTITAYVEGDSGHRSFWYNIPDTPWDTYYPVDALQLVGGYDETWRGDAPANQAWVDSVDPAANATVAFTFDGGGQGIVAYQDASDRREVFASFGLEAIRRNYFKESVSDSDGNSVDYVICKYQRARLLKNISGFLRTGSMRGKVVLKNGLTPVEGAIVTVTNGTFTYHAVTGADGVWVIEGMEPEGYAIIATKPGYTIDHSHWGDVEDASLQDTGIIQLTEAPPGAISGHVENEQGDPVFGAHVTATEANPTGTPVTGEAYTDANGDYTISSLPNTDYDVHCDAAGYSGQDYPDNPVTVNPGQTTTNIDFVLHGLPGHVYGTITGSDNPGVGLANARVRIEDGSGNIIKDIDGTDLDTNTDANGEYAFWWDDPSVPSYLDKVPAGTYTIHASAIGYQDATGTLVVTPSAGTQWDVQLDKLPPGNLRGLITDEATGLPMSGVTVELQPVGGGAAIDTTVTNGNTGYNYEFNNAEAGDYWVVPQASGALTPDPAYREVTIPSGDTLSGVNFVMHPPYAWSDGLFLMSIPGTFATDDPGTVLGLANSGIGNLARWNQATRDYDYYFNDGTPGHLEAGKGYWLLSNAGISIQQVPTDVAGPDFMIPLTEGWNMIGMPYQTPVSWYDLVVNYAGGSTKPIMQAATDGDIGSALWQQKAGATTYELASGMAPWKGYWLLVKNSNVVGLTVPKRSVRGTGTAALPQYELPFKTDWVLQLTAHAGDLTSGTCLVGAAPGATTGLDNGFDIAKPQPMASRPYVDVSVLHPERSGSGLFGVDIHGNDAVRQVWDLQLVTNQAAHDVVLSWNDLSQLPREYKVLLVDPDTGKTIYMRTASAYVFHPASRAGEQTKHLQLVVTREPVGALAVTGLAVDATRGTGVVRYTLSEEASVTTRIYNLGGTLVRTLEEEVQHSAGSIEVPWDGLDKSGRELPNGSYLVKVTAKAATGETITVFRTLVVLR